MLDRVSEAGLYELSAATIVPGAFKVINSSGLLEACYMIRIINNSDQTIFISYDGIYAHDVVRSGENIQLSSQENMRPGGFVSLFHKGQKFYATLDNFSKGGKICLCSYY